MLPIAFSRIDSDKCSSAQFSCSVLTPHHFVDAAFKSKAKVRVSEDVSSSDVSLAHISGWFLWAILLKLRVKQPW